MRILSVILVLLVVLGISACKSSKKENPEEAAVKSAFASFTSALNEKNWQKVWDGLSQKSQNAFMHEGYKRMQEIIEAMPPEVRKKKIESLGLTNNDILKMPPDKFFIFVMEQTQNSQEFSDLPLSGEVASVAITPAPVNAGKSKSEISERAVLKLKEQPEEAVMVKQGGIWKMEFED